MNLTKLLIEKKITISTMESCTSGLLASKITDTEGASAIFHGGIVTYSNEEKIKFGVDPAVIEKFGVYSIECAEEMARVCQKYFETDIAIAVTGTTGNLDPNNADSIRGLAFFSIRIFGKVHSFKIEENVSQLTRKQIKEMYVKKIVETAVKLFDNN